MSKSIVVSTLIFLNITIITHIVNNVTFLTRYHQFYSINLKGT